MPKTLPGRALRWGPSGLTDSQDGSNSQHGSMAVLSNLIPSPTTPRCWVPRPAAIEITTFPGFTSPAQINALLTVGDIAYGMIAETAGPFGGKDAPFAYNVRTNTFIPISIPGGAASLPNTPATTGGWTPPVMAVVGTSVIVTHPGFSGGIGPFFGWIDQGGLSSTTITGTTHGTTLIDTLSASPLTAGWQAGDTISGINIPANTTIVSLTATSVIVSNPVGDSVAGKALTVLGGTIAAPLWGSGNTNGTPLAAVPVSVIQFNGRAYYAVLNTLQFSDSLVPRQITNATQQLNPANGLAVTALGGLGFQQTLGGILQAIIAFQGDSQMQQVTGDPVTNDLQLNALSQGVGTIAPNTICQTSEGLAFVAPDGLRLLGFTGVVGAPIGAEGEGVNFPFLSVINPSRMCAAFNQGVLRITAQNGAVNGQPVQEYWYHLKSRGASGKWSGPHTFPAAMIEPYQSSPNHGFLMAPVGVLSSLWTSAVTPSVSDAYSENGSPLSFNFTTTLLPDNTEMISFRKIVASTLACAIANQKSLTLTFVDESGSPLDVVQLNGASQAPAIWGQVVWGNFLWGGPGSFLSEKAIPWHLALIFRQGQLQVTGVSALGTILGNINLQIEDLGYTLPASFPATPSPSPPPPTGRRDDGSFPVVNP